MILETKRLKELLKFYLENPINPKSYSKYDKILMINSRYKIVILFKYCSLNIFKTKIKSILTL